MNDRRAIVLPPLTQDGSGWYFRNYLLKANPTEEIDVAMHNRHLHRLIGEIENCCLSREFDYLRLGFIIGHLGQRGINVAFWHWGRWGHTNEIFTNSWYTYGRDYESLTLLDYREPVSCEFDVPILLAEFEFFRKAVADTSMENSREQLLKFELKL